MGVDQSKMAEIVTGAKNLILSVEEFAEEYGQDVLYGRPLASRAADQLSTMIRICRSLQRTLESG
jgi:hypothetical protein